eukprot:15365952-Ditylum_brightwellii.AAC.1
MTHYNLESATYFPSTPNFVRKEPAAILAEAPKIPPLEKPPVAKKHETMIHKFCVKIAFIIPADEDVCSHEKFAVLLALIIQLFPATVLQPWDHEEHDRMITAREDLPFEKDQLSMFCPHECHNDRLNSKWNLQCDMRFYFMKSNQCILDHINRYQIYINPTNIISKNLRMIGWFQRSHPKFTSRDNSVTKLSQRLDTDKKFDLHVHTVKFSTPKWRHSIKALVITCSRDKTWEMKNGLYKMNN